MSNEILDAILLGAIIVPIGILATVTLAWIYCYPRLLEELKDEIA